MTPRVTVLMPVYNGEKHLVAAIQSILGQTFRDFELLIIDDGSTDQSLARIAGFDDARIRLYRHEHNRGLVASLNTGLRLARGEYVARMDCDDVSFPERLARQVAFMDSHPQTGLCGTWFERHRNGTVEWARPATEDGEIRFWLLFKTTFLHSSVMLRHRLFLEHGLQYTNRYPHAEDYALWTQASSLMQLANIPEFLVAYRYHPDNTSSRHHQLQQTSAERVTADYLHRLDTDLQADDIRLHTDLVRFRTRGDVGTMQRIGAWLERLAALVETRFDQPGYRVYAHLAAAWYAACGRAAGAGWPVWRYYWQHPARRQAAWHWAVRLAVRCWLKHPIPDHPAPEP